MHSTAVFDFYQGSQPLLLSIPHAGTHIPDDIQVKLSNQAKKILDTDWYVDRLYGFAQAMDINIIKANYSRYVIDLNRPLNRKPLYSNINETGLCPTTTFDEYPIYLNECSPTPEEINLRIQNYWQPYHQKLKQELMRIKSEYGYALLWDAHSIKSEVLRFFQGRLPDFSLGSNDGKSCDKALTEKLYRLLQAQPEYTSVLNERFKGGYITRRYGQPEQNIHAVQLELSQITYMDEASLEFFEEKADKVTTVINALLQNMLSFSPR